MNEAMIDAVPVTVPVHAPAPAPVRASGKVHRSRRACAGAAGLALALAFTFGAGEPARAHEGHAGHDAPADDRRPAAAAPSATPGAASTAARVAASGASVSRFAAASDSFELVGALDGRRLILWLDRFGDNAPVSGASIEIEVGDAKVVAKAEAEVYVAELAAAPPPGTLPVTATIVAGQSTDLLASALVVTATDTAPARGSAVVPAGEDASGVDRRIVVASAVSAVLAGLAGWGLARRRTPAKESST